ncbi:MAG: L-threonylcarbamoyladenylate synthase, partial [Acidobacteriaceae bacterium]|nr:L-threonylcarbamoyladenylate synthase [Acidobacteriaceae bacterium]
KARVVPDLVTARTDTIGIRIPAHRIATDLILRALRPIAAPSANRFTEVSPTTADHVRTSLGDRVDMILDGGPTQVGIESTVVSLAGNEPEILRPGMISREELKAVTGLEWPVRNSTGHASASPGLHPKHYSPRTPLYVLRPGQPLPRGRGRMLEMPFSASEYAETLYAQLHKADIEGWDWIGVEEPPDNPEWEGIRDRLRRASTR